MVQQPTALRRFYDEDDGFDDEGGLGADDNVHFRSNTTAVYVSGMTEGSKSWRQGLRVGDQLLTLNGHPTFDSTSFQRACRALQHGEPVDMMLREKADARDSGRVYQVVVMAPR